MDEHKVKILNEEELEEVAGGRNYVEVTIDNKVHHLRNNWFSRKVSHGDVICANCG